MASKEEAVQGTIGGKPLSSGAQTKIHNALKSALEGELAQPGAVVGTHHGSIHISSWNGIFNKE